MKLLGNPKVKISVLEKTANRDGDIRRAISESEKNLERLESDRRITVEKLESYKDLDAQWAEINSSRESTAESYRIFIANEMAAKELANNETAFEEAKKDRVAVSERLVEAETAFETLGTQYDRERHLSTRAALIELQRRHAA